MRRLLMATMALASALPLGAQDVRVRGTAPAERQPYVRDSATLRVLTQGNESEVLRVVNELRAREARILGAMRDVPFERIAERRALEEELARISREAFTVMSLIESRCLEEKSTAPNGYLGVNVTTEVEVRDRIVSVPRSVITSVEPGSPAERAGLAAGDRLLSVAGRDTRERLPELAGVLEPGRRVTVRVERDGREREFPVTVVARPRGYDAGCPQFERAIQPLRMGGVARVWVHDSTDARGQRAIFVMTPGTPPSAPLAPAMRGKVAVTPAVPATPVSPVTPATPATPVPSTAPSPPVVFAFGTASGGASQVAYFAGAQFRALDDDWRAVLGLKAGTEGVLVNEIAPGSPAAQSGLKVGDVVTRIGSTPATSPIVAVRALFLNESQQARLQLVRARKEASVTLRWENATPR